jgi:uncharacterized membrane protein
MIVEQIGDRATVYVPVAPAVTIGFVYVLPVQRVRPVDGGIGEVFKVTRQFGRGALEMRPEAAGEGNDMRPPRESR